MTLCGLILTLFLEKKWILQGIWPHFDSISTLFSPYLDLILTLFLKTCISQGILTLFWLYLDFFWRYSSKDWIFHGIWPCFDLVLTLFRPYFELILTWFLKEKRFWPYFTVILTLFWPTLRKNWILQGIWPHLDLILTLFRLYFDLILTWCLKINFDIILTLFWP